MRRIRLHIPQPLAIGQTLELPEDAFNHAIRVLRLRPGDTVTVFNGQRGEFIATLDGVERRSAWVRIDGFFDRDCESPLRVTLVQAVAKGERMDYALQKAVELGVYRIVPVLSARSAVNLDAGRWDKRLAHWRGVVAGACEQCGRNILPEVAAVQPLSDALGDAVPGLVLAPEAGAHIKALPAPAGPLSVLIGPEGGLTEGEIALARAAGLTAVSLGPRVLRTETAGAVVLAAMQTLWGDVG